MMRIDSAPTDSTVTTTPDPDGCTSKDTPGTELTEVNMKVCTVYIAEKYSTDCFHNVVQGGKVLAHR